MFLEVKNLDAGYGFLHVLRGLSFSIDRGEYVCLIGPNGAGKSTTLKTIAGLLKPMGGTITFDGRSIGGMPANLVAGLGLVYISEELNLFVNMTVHENLLLGGYLVREKDRLAARLEEVYDLFPRLRERFKQLAGTMSGGERKMLAIGRALMSYPELLLVDEPSFGLAPKITDNVFEALDRLNHEQGLTIVVVEQNVNKTLACAQRGYVVEFGAISVAGTSAELAANDHVKKAYLGV
ncbi:ABC transporter ATP-binding protein [Deltaproteobacteria bacterium OttesenSCG-928-M10]|nr:ABC transporter ATP-binding protein [Deltaproteobacteria bacterium OttesenSCG-928-M10]